MAPLQLHRFWAAWLAAVALGLPKTGWSLPITSEPLAYNPADLAWQALLSLDTQPHRLPYEETRAKVAKSIFIAPNFNESAITCKSGYRHDPKTNKCHKVNIELNQQNLLTMQALQAFVGSTGNRYGTVTAPPPNQPQSAYQQQLPNDNDHYGDSVEYDYDEEIEVDDVSEALSGIGGGTGPYHVPLTLSFGSDRFAGTTATLTDSEHTVDANGKGNDDPAPVPDNAVESSQPTRSSYFRDSTTVGPAAGATGHVRPAGGTPIPATTLDDVAFVVGLPESMVEAGSTIALLPNRLLTTRAVEPAPVAATTEMAPTAAADAATTQSSTEVPSTTTVTAPTTGATDTTDESTDMPVTTTDVPDAEVAATEPQPTDVAPLAAGSSDVLDNTILTTAVDETEPTQTASSPSTPVDTVAEIFAEERNDLKMVADLVALVESDPLTRELLQDALLPDTNDKATTTMSPDATDDTVQTTTPANDSDDVTDVPNTTAMPEPAAADNDRLIIVSEPLSAVEELTVAESSTTPATVTTALPLKSPPTSVSSAQPQPSETIVFIVTPEPPPPPASTEPDAMANRVQSATESATILQQRETILQHEQNEDARDRIDQHNRFVYAHLEPPVNNAEMTSAVPTAVESTASTGVVSTTTTTTTTEAAPTTTPSESFPSTSLPMRRTLIEQLRLINRLTEDARRRINAEQQPHDQHRPSIFVNRRTGGASTGFRFPTAADGRSAPAVTDAATAASSLFNWLPANWRIASTRDGGQPANGADRATSANRKALNFWHGMPLIRDPALDGATDRATRANSKSPTERLFRQDADALIEQPAGDEVFRVLTTKNTRYHNR